MPGGSSRAALLVVVGVVTALAGYVTMQWTSGGRTVPRAATPPAAARPPTEPGAPAPRLPRERIVAAAKDLLRKKGDAPQDDAPADDAGAADQLPDAEDSAEAWATVDMDAVRKAMPDNLYWKMGAPTKDPDVLHARDEERDRWNAVYGKVLSNTATAEEIDAYYAHQELLSTDYLEFVTYMLTNYGGVLPKRDVAMLKLAGEMHLARLEEIPRKITEANERREAHDAARRAWLADQKAFGGDSPDGQ
jgi:hypothetical protein